jgi:hypothetical protein
MYASPRETGVGCLMILTSIPVYFVFIAWKSKPRSFQQAMGEFNTFVDDAFPSQKNLDSLITMQINQKITGALTQKLQKMLMVVRGKSQQV